MTTTTIDLADILSRKLQFGISLPISIDIGDLLEYADDDWDYELDLDTALDADRKVAIVFSADDAKRVRPHLTDVQAWEVARITRDDFAYAVDDFLGDVADVNFPTTRHRLQRRLDALRTAANAPDQSPSDPLTRELLDAQRLLDRLLTGAETNPALEGFIAAAIDDVERAVAAETASGTEA